MDYFLEQRVTDVQSDVREGGGALREVTVTHLPPSHLRSVEGTLQETGL